jgi:integrase
MPKLNLTERAIARMPAPDLSGRQVLYWDSDLKGFAVLCSGTTNAKTFVVQRDLPNKKTRRLTVAAVNEVTLEKARDLAADMLLDLRRGVDPKRKDLDATLAATLESYLAARTALRPASVRVYRQVEKYLAPWLALPLRTISSDMIEARHRSLATEVGTSTANGVMRTFRVLWNFYAERQPELPPNPVRRLRRQWFSENVRTRMVRTDQLPAFYAAVNDLPNEVVRDYLLLLLFTGMRRTEAATLKWDDVDLVEGVIRVPAARTKGKRKLDLPMSDVVHDMLVTRRRLGDAQYIFPGPGASHHIGNPESQLKTVAAACGIKVSSHDLRRTFLTVAEGCNVSPMALKAMVNHSMGNDITAGYVQMNVERLREPVQVVADKIKVLCGIVPPAGDNISPLRLGTLGNI